MKRAIVCEAEARLGLVTTSATPVTVAKRRSQIFLFGGGSGGVKVVVVGDDNKWHAECWLLKGKFIEKVKRT